MIPAPFEYHAPKTLEEALRLVERHGDEAKVLRSEERRVGKECRL